jgi:hypothetical protein
MSRISRIPLLALCAHAPTCTGRNLAENTLVCTVIISVPSQYPAHKKLTGNIKPLDSSRRYHCSTSSGHCPPKAFSSRRVLALSTYSFGASFAPVGFMCWARGWAGGLTKTTSSPSSSS